MSLFVPHITIVTPIAHVLPHSLRSNAFVTHLVTVQFAQYQDVLAQLTGARPAFPFQYTNTWSEALVLLLPWFLITTMRGPKTLFQRAWPIGILLLAVYAVVYSLNRGAWIGLGIGVVYMIIRLAMRGQTLPAVIVLAVGGDRGDSRDHHAARQRDHRPDQHAALGQRSCRREQRRDRRREDVTDHRLRRRIERRRQRPVDRDRPDLVLRPVRQPRHRQ